MSRTHPMAYAKRADADSPRICDAITVADADRPQILRLRTRIIRRREICRYTHLWSMNDSADSLSCSSSSRKPARWENQMPIYSLLCMTLARTDILTLDRRQRLLRDDVINDVIRPVSTIREEHIDTPFTGTLY